MSDVLVALYPIFKEEVFRRGTRIATLGLAGSGGMLAGMFWFASMGGGWSVWDRVLCAAAVAVAGGSLLYHIDREGARHAGAKEGLIRLERALGLFDAGRHLPDDSLYPRAWQVAPPRGRATRGAQLGVLAITLLFIAELWIGG